LLKEDINKENEELLRAVMEICENGKIKKKYQKLGTKNKKRIIPSKKSVPTCMYTCERYRRYTWNV